MTAPYASYHYTQSIMGAVQTTAGGTSINEDKLMSNLRTVSRRVDHVFASRRPLFLPYRETRKFPLDGTRVNSWQGTFSISGYLLALTSLDVAGDAVTAVEGYPDSTMPPFSLLHLTDCCAGWYGYCSDDCNAAARQVSVTGIWGFHSDYANAWLAVDAVTTTAITTTTATTFTVANAATDDAYGQPNRISPGHLLRIDDEWMEVVGVATNTVTVIRGVNGSTAATHALAAVVYRWEVDEPVKRAVARQAGMLYARFGAYTTMEVQGMSEVRYPADWLQEVMGTLQGYVYLG